MIITSDNLMIHFKNDKEEYVFPMNSLIFIGSDISDTITIKLKSSKRDIFAFDYTDIEGKSFSNIKQAIEYLTNVSNK